MFPSLTVGYSDEVSVLDRRPSLPQPIAGPALPRPRGPRTEHLLAHLRRSPHDPGPIPPAEDDGLDGDDSALALHVLYELHYRGFEEVAEEWEWAPGLLAVRAALELEFERRLSEELGPVPVALSPDDVGDALDLLAAGGGGPSLSAWVAEQGELWHLQEFAAHRAIYQLKEADPHTFGIPRLTGRAKAALVEIQMGEYGDGRPESVHATMFADTMRHLGLDDSYGTYLDHVPGVTLATGNLISLFGLHRRWRGALAGHLALFEMCSVGPMGRYAAALRRLGVDERAARFYDVHVEADAAHQVIARNDLAVALATEEPVLAGEIVFGARAIDLLERRLTAHLLAAWERHQSSLLQPLQLPV
jgi:hypothetical protein